MKFDFPFVNWWMKGKLNDSINSAGPSAIHSIHFIFLFRMGKMIELMNAAAIQRPTPNFLLLFHQINWKFIWLRREWREVKAEWNELNCFSLFGGLWPACRQCSAKKEKTKAIQWMEWNWVGLVDWKMGCAVMGWWASQCSAKSSWRQQTNQPKRGNGVIEEESNEWIWWN